MRRRKRGAREVEAERVQKWFERSVSYEGKPYTIDFEQAMAVVDGSKNTIVVARAGSGKTRTIVAKIVYLVAKCGVKPEEILAFVFNANAASEINARLSKMRVDDKPVMSDVKIANTFHAFARKVVWNLDKGHKCGEILAEKKELFIFAVVQGMMKNKEWREKIWEFIGGDEKMVGYAEELQNFAKKMEQFVNRAQQKYLAGEETLRESIGRRLEQDGVEPKEKLFIELGAECFRRYHYYLLSEKMRRRLCLEIENDFCAYGTDFNLIVSWASKMIAGKRDGVEEMLGGKKYILVDEYQDFSQLFLSVVLAIRKVIPGVKLFVVGDDWQAINRFAGSEVKYFREFEKYFPEDSKRLEITTNYRCNYMVVDTARRFMMKAMGERGDFWAKSRQAGKVVLVDPRETEMGYAVVEYDTRVSRKDRMFAETMKARAPKTADYKNTRYLKTLAEILMREKRAESILLLHRNNDTSMGVSISQLGDALKTALIKMGVFNEETYGKKVKVMTMHKSKGLEAEAVVILEADEGVIPKKHPDAGIYGVFGEDDVSALDDQKRLFYVAMTRAKKRLYIIHNESKGVGFVKYLGRSVGKWEE